MDNRTTVFKSVPAPDPLVGRVINERFKVIALIARGGMGKVYRAEQAPLGRACALKVLNPAYDGERDPEFHRRFFLEASIASKLTHPNTVTIFDYGRTDDDIYYMAMEYLEGRNLHRAIRDAVSFSQARSVHIGRQICRALREAHAHGVIHRDLKPANVFLVEHGDEADFVKVLDFGLVKNVVEGMDEELTKAGLFMGSPKYMAPEQVRGIRMDARTDIYGLGIVLFEMMVGRVPFDAPSTINILTAQLNQTPPRVREANPEAEISEEFEAVIARCMAKDPNHRFGSMDEVLAAMRTDGQTMTQSIELSTHVAPAAASSTGVLGPMAMPGESTGTLPLTAISSGAARSRRAALGALLGAVAAAGIVAYAAFRPGTPTSAEASQGAAAVSIATSASFLDRATPAAGGPALTKLHISSVPDGAAVREDGVEVCGSTPCDLEYRGVAAALGHEHRLTISRPGYSSESKVVKIVDGPVSVRLVKATDAPRSASPSQPKSDKPATPPAGYRTELPY